MVLASALGLAAGATIALSVGLAFVFGYLLTMLPLLKSGLAFRASLGLAFASDTTTIFLMEVVDNAGMLLIPGAMDAGLTEPRFWGSLAVALTIAGMLAFPVVRFLIARGRGHALVHQHHGRARPGSHQP
jgi:hypothetical protein